MSDTTCIVCTDLLASKPLGVVVPCGHCFHEHCYQAWEAARGRNVFCPICNGKPTQFVKLFLPLGEMQADDDESGSLSSTSTLGEQSYAGVGVHEEPGEQSGEGNDGGEPDNDESQPPDAADLPHFVQVPAGTHNVVDLLSDTSQPPRRTESTGPRHGSDSNDDRYFKLRRKAKRLKRRVEFLEGKRAELVKVQRVLSEEKKEILSSCMSMQAEIDALDRETLAQERELTDCRAALNRVRRERDVAENELDKMNDRVRTAESNFRKLMVSHREEIQKAGVAHHAEVQEMLKEHPKLVQEKHDLRIDLSRCRKRIEELEKACRSRGSSSTGQTDRFMQREPLRQRKVAGNVARAFQDSLKSESRRDERKQEKQETFAQVQALSSRASQQGSRVSKAAIRRGLKPKRTIDVLNVSRNPTTVARHVSIPGDGGKASESLPASYPQDRRLSLNIHAKRRKAEPTKDQNPQATSRAIVVLAPFMAKNRRGTDIRHHFDNCGED